MCNNHEHRYIINMVIGGNEEKFDLIVNARSISEAIAKADGYAFENYPGKMVQFSTFHVGYRDEATALEHGAKLTTLEELARRKSIFLQGPPSSWPDVLQIPS